METKIWKFLVAHWFDILLFLLSFGGMLMLAIIKKWFSSEMAPLTPLILLVALWSYFGVLNQIKKYRKRKPIDYQDLIKNWLFKYEFSVQKIDEADKEWMIKSARKDSGIPFLVAVNKSEPEYVAIICNTKLEESEWSLIDAITSNPRLTLLEDLRIEIARLGIEYQGLGHPLRIVTLSHKMAKESMTELDFLQTALRVRSAHNIYVNLLAKYRKTTTI